jgi:hypothetical protein
MRRVVRRRRGRPGLRPRRRGRPGLRRRWVWAPSKCGSRRSLWGPYRFTPHSVTPAVVAAGKRSAMGLPALGNLAVADSDTQARDVTDASECMSRGCSTSNR